MGLQPSIHTTSGSHPCFHHALSQRRRFVQVLGAFHCEEGVAGSPAIKTHSYSHPRKVDIRLPGKGNLNSHEAGLLRSSR